MPHLVQIGLKRAPTRAEAASFPFSVPAVRSLPVLDVEVPVTLFVGENGSGKSTLLEAIAVAAELPALGVSEVAADDTLTSQRRLGELLRLAWRPRSPQGFFLRAEDFFGHLRMQARTEARIFREKGLLGDPHNEVAGGAGALHWERNREIWDAVQAASFDDLVLAGELSREIREDFSSFMGARKEY